MALGLGCARRPRRDRPASPTSRFTESTGTLGAMAFLQRVAAATRQGVLAHIRLAPASAGLQVGAASAHSLRLFASASYLDKSEVTSRVLDIVKNFDKVEPSKVRGARDGGGGSGMGWERGGAVGEGEPSKVVRGAGGEAGEEGSAIVGRVRGWVGGAAASDVAVRGRVGCVAFPMGSLDRRWRRDRLRGAGAVPGPRRAPWVLRGWW